MNHWTPERVALAAGARLPSTSSVTTGPDVVTIDSRTAGPGGLFVGLPGEHHDGGQFARQALANGAWGVLVAPQHAAGIGDRNAVVLSAEEPLVALQRLATAWRRELGASVIGVTGSTGKTSTKDLLLAVLAPHRRTVASRANFNTEIGLPLEILAARPGTEVLILEMGMRGEGQIAELAQIAEPDVAVIVSVGPVHLEMLGTIERVAAAKAELIASLAPGGTAVVPAGERLLEPHLRAEITTLTFGPGGDFSLAEQTTDRVTIETPADTITLTVPFTQAHLRRNLLAAVAAATAVGVRPSGGVELQLSPGRGQRVDLAGGVTVIDDCYNANPMSMRAALEDLAATASRTPGARPVAVLGDMLELGPDAAAFHADVGDVAREAGVELLVTVGPLAASIADRFDGEHIHAEDSTHAAALLPGLIHPGDVVLVKASRGVKLELAVEALAEGVGV